MKGRKNLNTMLSERHELNKIALLELKKDVEETREFSSYFSKMADLLLYVNEIYDTKERTLEQLKQWNRIWYEEARNNMHIVLGIQNFVQKSLEKSMVRFSHFYMQRCAVDLSMRSKEDCLTL